MSIHLDSSKPSFSRDTRLLLTASPLYGLSMFGINNVLNVLFQLRLGLTASSIGSISATGAGAYAVGSLCSASIVKRKGISRTILLGVIAMAVSLGLYPLALFLNPGLRVIWMSALNGTMSMGWGIVTSLESPAFAASTPARQRARALGANSGIRNMGRLTGILAGGFLPALASTILGIGLESPAAYAAGLWVSFTMLAIAILPVARLRRLESSTTEGTDSKQPVPTKIYILLGLSSFLSVWSQAAVQIFGNAYLDTQYHLSAPAISRINALAILVAMLASFSCSRVIDRWGLVRIMSISMLLMGVLALPIALIPGVTAATISIVGEATLGALCFISLASYHMRMLPTGALARISGIACASTGAGFMLIAQAGGILVDAIGYNALFLYTSLASIPGLIIVLTLPRAPIAENKTQAIENETP